LAVAILLHLPSEAATFNFGPLFGLCLFWGGYFMFSLRSPELASFRTLDGNQVFPSLSVAPFFEIPMVSLFLENTLSLQFEL